MLGNRKTILQARGQLLLDNIIMSHYSQYSCIFQIINNYIMVIYCHNSYHNNYCYFTTDSLLS